MIVVVVVVVAGGGGSIDGPATLNVTAALTPVFPALSAWIARAVYVPTASGVDATLNAPEPPSRVAVSVATGVPAATAPA